MLDDLLSRPLSTNSNAKQTAGLVDRAGNTWVVFARDGTREAARHRVLPQTEALPPASRRLEEVGAPGYTGRKRGHVVRTRTGSSQAHSFQWLGSFGTCGTGRSREDRRQGRAAITRSLTAHQLSQARTRLRLDGQSGTGAVRADRTGLAVVTRGKPYTARDHPQVQARLPLPPDQGQGRPASPWCAASTTVRRAFAERVARKARAPTAGRVKSRPLGVPGGFADWLGRATA